MGTFKGAAKGGAGLQKTQTDPRAIAAAATASMSPMTLAAASVDPLTLRNLARGLIGGKPVAPPLAVPGFTRPAVDIVKARKELYARMAKLLGVVPAVAGQEFRVVK